MAKKVSEREGRLRQIGFRTTEQMSQRLSQAASQSGRSLTQEIESRLEATLVEENFLTFALGHDVYEIASAIRRALALIEDPEDKSWLNDDETYELFRAVILEIVRNYRDQVRENRRPTPMGRSDDKTREELAQMYAALAMTPPRLSHPSLEEQTTAPGRRDRRKPKDKR